MAIVSADEVNSHFPTGMAFRISMLNCHNESYNLRKSEHRGVSFRRHLFLIR